MADGRWNPWRSLRERPQAAFARVALPEHVHGVAACWPEGDELILLDVSLGRRERAEVLGHELVHLERGIGIEGRLVPEAWRAVVAREETTVEREVARRLLPLGELKLFVAARLMDDEPTTVLDVAEEFDVTEALAAIALDLL